jgi:hypothetical protein
MQSKWNPLLWMLGVLLGLIGTSLTAWLVSRVLNESMRQAHEAAANLSERLLMPQPVEPEKPRSVEPVRTAGPVDLGSVTQDVMPAWAEEMEREDGWLVDPLTGRPVG